MLLSNYFLLSVLKIMLLDITFPFFTPCSLILSYSLLVFFNFLMSSLERVFRRPLFLVYLISFHRVVIQRLLVLFAKCLNQFHFSLFIIFRMSSTFVYSQIQMAAFRSRYVMFNKFYQFNWEKINCLLIIFWVLKMSK